VTATAEVPVLGERLWLPIDETLRGVDRTTSRFIPKELNPFMQAGGIANTCLIVAVVTGVALLLWYVPSVHQAYDSMRAIDDAPFTSGLVRSLHRYSSDACMLFVLLHAFKVFAAKRFTGPRWLAWVTGLVVLFLLWLVGFLGYWLVWDERAQLVATGSARVLDVLPIFTDPMERSFLTDSSVNSLLFFVVFFAHMLLPLAMGIGLWLHIARLNKANLFTKKPLTLWVLGSLILVSLVFPGQVAEPARMTVPPTGFSMDYWYLLPVALMDRLSGGALWLVVLIPGAILMSAPWWMARRKIRPATVEISRCNSCGKCEQDCPFNAITLVPRTDGKDFTHQSQVDPGRCVGCGICAGSCDTAGIGLRDWFPVENQRALLERWVAEDPDSPITLACAHGPRTRGERVLEVPCAGWIHPYTLERLLARNASMIRVVSCAPGDCRYRHGPEFIEERLTGRREPALRTDNIDPSRIQLQGGETQSDSSTMKALVVAGVVLLFGLVTWWLSDAPYTPPHRAEPELVVSFRHPGAVKLGRLLTAKERARYPAYMKRKRVRMRGRTPVRLRVEIDGQTVHEHSYPATGIQQDGDSIAIVRLPITAGSHVVAVSLGDTEDPDKWTFETRNVLDFDATRRRVVLFDRVKGFRWDGVTQPR
jgi:ferredoxin